TLSKEFKKAPNMIADELLKKIKPTKNISKIEVKGPYLNFFINRELLNEQVITKILKEKNDYGLALKKKEKVMIEYSQPNTHKAFHVGHLRNVCMGDSLIRILKNKGYNVIAANYIGDVGAHIAKCLWYYKKHFKGQIPKNNKGEWLGELYTKAVKKLKEKEAYKEEVSEILKQLESEKNNEIIALWKQTRKWSLDEFKEIYDWLGANFDIYFYESDVEKSGKQLVEKYKKKGLFVKSEGALIMDLKKYDLDVFLVLKSDGTSLYSTKDLSLAVKKFEEYKIDQSLYVVGSEQKMYFKQLFKTLELMGFKNAKNCKHVSYELVMLPDGKMSSRAGNIMLFSELKNEIMKKLEKEVIKRHKDWSMKKVDETAKKIGLGALKFGMLNQDSNRVIIFNLNEWLSFEGETGPYIQYAVARINSIFKKSKGVIGEVNYSMLKSAEEQLLISKLADYPKLVENSADNLRPSMIARYLLELAQGFNEFYHKHQVLKADSEVRGARMALIISIKQVLKNGLSLLGIEAPDEM
ncbi:MAG: arginine--tRNA ligase, partial [Nanoarchaeota archaeon]|nr:arginine--tRNA ligase [Nanoarchaeota archaeon]